MRPFYEQTLRAKFNGGNTAILDESGTIIATGVSKEAQAALLAHGGLVRALLGHGYFGKGLPQEWHTRECWGDDSSMECLPSCVAASAALRKAGVIAGGES